MAYALIAHVEANGTPDGVTTGSVDTSGASFLVASVAWYPGVTANATMSDSKGNTWAGLTAQSNGGISKNRLFYCSSPSVGSGHTFSATGTQTYPCVQVLAFSGSSATPFDAENGANDNASTILTGSVTPSEANELVIAGLGHYDNSSGAVSINGGFTNYNSPFVASNSLGGGIGYLIQTSAAAANPTWDISTATYVAATIACFKSAGGGGGSVFNPYFYRFISGGSSF